MSDDIVERLRGYVAANAAESGADVLLVEAADEIERLRDELEQLFSMVRILGSTHNDKRVLEVRPRDEVMPGAFIAKLK